MTDEITREGKAQRLAEELIRASLATSGIVGIWLQKEVSIEKIETTRRVYHFKVLVHQVVGNPNHKVEATCEVVRETPECDWKYGDVFLKVFWTIEHGEGSTDYKYQAWLTKNGIYVRAPISIGHDVHEADTPPAERHCVYVDSAPYDHPGDQPRAFGSTYAEALGNLLLQHGAQIGFVIDIQKEW